jgi:hypothetical protein
MPSTHDMGCGATGRREAGRAQCEEASVQGLLGSDASDLDVGRGLIPAPGLRDNASTGT